VCVCVCVQISQQATAEEEKRRLLEQEELRHAIELSTLLMRNQLLAVNLRLLRPLRKTSRTALRRRCSRAVGLLRRAADRAEHRYVEA
jgi:hypothetical protein